MNIVRKITLTGVTQTNTNSERRNLILSNYISLIVSAVPLLLIGAVILFSTFDLPLVLRLAVASVIFILPLGLNRLGLTVVSRITLCWLPPIIIFAICILDIRNGSPMSASSFVGLRLFLLTTSCFPFLVFNIRGSLMLYFGLLGPLLSLIFFDPIFIFFGAPYWLTTPPDPLYSFNNVRAIVSFIALTLSCSFLKLLVERNEALNEQLIREVEQKNMLILMQKENDVSELNQQLTAHIAQLEEREFNLTQTQKIAKIGTWEYRIEGASLFCSDEVYNIFGVDKSYVFTQDTLTELIAAEDCEILFFATDNLLRTSQSFDITVRARNLFGQTKWIRINAVRIAGDDRVRGARGICHDITYFRQAEEMLRSSERKYRSLFEQASDFIILTDLDGKLIDVNESLCTAIGYRRDELRKLTIASLLDPADLIGNPLDYDELMHGEPAFSERRIKHKNGAVIFVESNARKIHDDMILIIARDVTSLRNAQRLTSLSEALFRSAFEHSAIGMALVSPDSRWLRVNDILCNMTGYSENDLLEDYIDKITHPDDHASDRTMIERLLSGESERLQMEKRFIHKNGSVVWVNLNASVVRDESGFPLFLVAQIEDITVERLEHEKFMLSQANLNATINNTEVFIWSVDSHYRLLTYNDSFYNYIKERYGIGLQLGVKVFGETSELSAEMYERWEPRFERVLMGESFRMEESRFGIDFQYSMSPIKEGGKFVGVSVIADNVTEHKQRDLELAEATKKIGELKLMALRSVMNPHFIFNVLNSIQYYITKSDRYNAINYLSMFSRLIRTILTQSMDNKIKLSDEIELLSNYIRLEMTRFENKFNFLLVIDPKVEADSIEIPSLLIQPFVENALLHGLYNKQGRGTLTIRIRQEEEMIIFEIEDDGIGRDAALKLRASDSVAHKSMGVHITEERLKLINQDQVVAFHVEDLSKNGIAAGTRVTIKIGL